MPHRSSAPIFRCLFVAALILAGCASQDENGSADPTTSQSDVAPTTTVEQDAASSSTPTSTVPDADDSGENLDDDGSDSGSADQDLGDGDDSDADLGGDTADSDDASDGTFDDDRSPPTTGTNGLAATIESTIAPTGLTCERLENFGNDSLDRWVVVNDGVMGGLSKGEVEVGGGVIRFSGEINTNGGGFSLMRTSTLRDGASLSDALAGVDYLRLRVRSANGRGYELIAEDQSRSQIMHFAPLPVSDEGLWQEPLIPLADLEARAFGNQLSGSEPFQIEEVTSIGIILADGLDGPFSLEVNRIDACRQ